MINAFSFVKQLSWHPGYGQAKRRKWRPAARRMILLDMRGELPYRVGEHRGHLKRIVKTFCLAYPLLLCTCPVWGKNNSITLVLFNDKYKRVLNLLEKTLDYMERKNILVRFTNALISIEIFYVWYSIICSFYSSKIWGGKRNN